jgi:hypothetical protein
MVVNESRESIAAGDEQESREGSEGKGRESIRCVETMRWQDG